MAAHPRYKKPLRTFSNLVNNCSPLLCDITLKYIYFKKSFVVIVETGASDKTPDG